MFDNPDRDVATATEPGGPSDDEGSLASTPNSDLDTAAVSGRASPRWRRWYLVALPVLGAVLWFAGSYGLWMLQPTSMNWSERSSEWIRADVPFGNWMVDEGEHVYYTANAPKKGGPGLKKLPSVGLTTPVAPTVVPAPVTRAKLRVARPPRVKPVFPHPFPGEGVWKPTGPAVDGGPPVLVTTFRTELDYPTIVAYVAWFDHTRTALAYYPGRYEPPNAAVRGPMMVPDDQRSRLLAAFNGGFTHVDGNNGSADNGHTNEPLIDGNATLIGYRSGRVAIVKWSGGPDVGSDVAWARQSLTPIVWNGQINPLLDTDPNSPQWGYTLGGVTRVWRTGVGIDRHGNLFYVVANNQTVVTLAKILQHIGAIRGMEFDINPEWHTLITYTHQHGKLAPKMVEPQPMQSPDRYLVPDDRDFIAVYRRLPGPVSVPFK
jgi:hypothetical protein